MTYTPWQYEFDLVTPSGLTIAECIEFRCDLSGTFERGDPSVGIGDAFLDVACENVEIMGLRRRPSHRDPKTGLFSPARNEAVWIPIPPDLRAYFDRWLDGPGEDAAQGALFEARRDDADAAADYKYEQRRDAELDEKWRAEA